jgi:molybdopterin/thiamine biosynthesis adenylyltransferase
MATVVIIGAGGAIGSHLVGHVARLPAVHRLLLVDWGTYEPSNLLGQDITLADLERPKVQVQARRARRIRPGLEVVPLFSDIAAVPRGLLRGEVICACLDSRWARQRVNEAAWRLGVPWVDAGIRADGLLARVDVFLPGETQPCLECGWDERDYAALEQAYPCSGQSAPEAPPTASPSSLAGLAAAIEAMRCRRLLERRMGPDRPGLQVVIAAEHHAAHLVQHRRNPHCRLSDHGVWDIRPLPIDPRRHTIGDLLDAARAQLGSGNGGAVGLRIEGKRFVRHRHCPTCGDVRNGLRLAPSLLGGGRRCARCRSELRPMGWTTVERLEESDLTRRDRARSLARMGIAGHEIVSVGTTERELHFELRSESEDHA